MSIHMLLNNQGIAIPIVTAMLMGAVNKDDGLGEEIQK